MGSCLGGLLGAEQVLAWQWAAMSASLLRVCKKTLPALEVWWHGTKKWHGTKSKDTDSVSPRLLTLLLDLTRTEGGVVPCWGGTHKGTISCSARIPWDSSCLLQKLPPGGKAMEGHSIHPSAPGSRRNFSLQEMSKCHPSSSPSVFWIQVFNEWRKTD